MAKTGDHEPVDPLNGLTEQQVRRALIGPPAGGNGRKPRRVPPTERRRVTETWSGRIGADLKGEIRELAERHGVSQGQIGRVLLLAGLRALEGGQVSFSDSDRKEG